mmetsp:Transcript_8202/g.19991  ORF Transcript_8202/g.19991 Transcript_8202/m.19991 type:complete len:200 (-) Transcript_8202:388-987(-)
MPAARNAPNDWPAEPLVLTTMVEGARGFGPKGVASSPRTLAISLDMIVPMERFRLVTSVTISTAPPVARRCVSASANVVTSFVAPLRRVCPTRLCLWYSPTTVCLVPLTAATTDARRWWSTTRRPSEMSSPTPWSCSWILWFSLSHESTSLRFNTVDLSAEGFMVRAERSSPASFGLRFTMSAFGRSSSACPTISGIDL